LKLEALLRRLPKDHPKRNTIEKDYMKFNSGFIGEKKIDYFLDLLPEKEYSIFHNVRLKNEENRYFQIDTLLITNKYILLLEVKNILGNIIFEKDFNQFIRIQGQSEEAFPNPLLQIDRHQKQLRSFFQKHKLEIPPLYSFIIISNSSSVIKTSNRHSNILENVFHAEQLPLKIQKLDYIEAKQLLSLKQIRKIAKVLLKNHTPLASNVLERYNISEDEINKGVICPKCSKNKMKRQFGKWYCDCSYQSKDAHIQAIFDFAYLISSTITNQQCRDFLDLSSGSIASTLLKSLNMNQTGHTKGSKYIFQLED
jgi:ribosomal protein L37AE/L43A